MFEELRRLGRETLVYGLSTVLGRLLNLLLLPLYTHFLAPAEYGVAATVFSYLAFLNVLFGYGMDFSFMRHARAGEEGGAEPRAAFSTAFVSLLTSSLVLAALVHLAAEPLARAGDLPAELSDIVGYAAWILAFDALATLPFAQLRLSHRAGTYAGVKVVNIAMNLVLTWVFLRMGMGVRGVFLATLVTSCATFAMLGPVVVLEFTGAFDPALWRRMLAFALPLVPGGLASMAVQVIDRPLLKFLADDAAVGLYQASYRLGVFMMMAVNMFDAAWRPFFLQKGGGPEGGRLLARVMTYCVLGGSVLLLALSLFVPHLVALPLPGGRTLIPSVYWGGLAIVPAVTLAYLFNGVYVNLIAPVTLARRSGLIAWATGLGALVKVVGTILLIPVWGLQGPAAATLLAYFSMAAALYLMGRRVHPVPYEWGRLARVAAAVAVVGLAARVLGLGMDADRVLARASLIALFPALLLLSGFLDEDETKRLKSLLRRR